MSGGRLGFRGPYDTDGVWSLGEVSERIRLGRWANYLTAVLRDSPVGLWLLNESSGTIAKDSAGNLHGTYTGGYTLNQSGPPNVGAAVLLNGTSGYIALGAPAALNLTAAWHLEAWVYLTSTPNGAGIITEELAGSGNILYELGFGSVSSSGGSILSLGFYTGSAWESINTTCPSLNTWHLIGGEYTGSSLTLFVDGAQVVTGTTSLSPVAGISNSIMLGRRHTTDTSPYLPGRMAAAAIYPGALGLARHQAHYYAGS